MDRVEVIDAMLEKMRTGAFKYKIINFPYYGKGRGYGRFAIDFQNGVVTGYYE